MVSLREAKKNLKEAEAKFAAEPTAENEQAMLEAKYIITLVIGIYLFSALLPSAITALNGANTTGWTTTQMAIYAVIGVVVLAVVIIKITE